MYIWMCVFSIHAKLSKSEFKKLSQKSNYVQHINYLIKSIPCILSNLKIPATQNTPSANNKKKKVKKISMWFFGCKHCVFICRRINIFFQNIHCTIQTNQQLNRFATNSFNISKYTEWNRLTIFIMMASWNGSM